MKRLIYVLLLFCSCRTPHNQFEQNLTSNGKYWIYHECPSEQIKNKGGIVWCTKFYKDYDYQILESSNGILAPISPLEKPQQYVGKWYFDSSDSTFEVGNQKFKVNKYKSDTIFIISPNGQLHQYINYKH